MDCDAVTFESFNIWVIIAGTEASNFNIDNATGVITAAAPLVSGILFGDNTTATLGIHVVDKRGLTGADVPLVIYVLYPPECTDSSYAGKVNDFTSGSVFTLLPALNCTDGDGDILTYSLTGIIVFTQMVNVMLSCFLTNMSNQII